MDLFTPHLKEEIYKFSIFDHNGFIHLPPEKKEV